MNHFLKCISFFKKDIIKSFSCLLILLFAYNFLYAAIDIDFSHTRGFYSQSFNLTIQTDNPGSVIKYTLDSSEPGPNTGTIYTNPIPVSSTTIIRAMAFTNTDTTSVKTHSLLFLNDVINQQDPGGNFPYSVDLSTTITQDPVYAPQILSALLQIPTMSLCLDLSDYNFIYNNKGIEKAASIEFIDSINDEKYAVTTGVSTYGNTSFSASNANKKNYRLKFQTIFGAGKFDYPIFGDSGADDFDVLDLRAGSQETIDRGGVQNIHEQFLKNLQLKISNDGVRGKFVHLYINGMYWGVYTLSERPNKSFGESYFGGNKDDYNTVKATCCNTNELAIDGTIDSYNTMKSEVVNYSTINNYLDVQQFIDYVLVCNFGPHGDWRTWNTYALDNPVNNVPYKFYIWDPEPSLDNGWYYTNKLTNTRDHESIWQPLKANADFRMKVADGLECNCIQDDGAINSVNAENYYVEMFEATQFAYMMECARWADKNLYIDFLDYKNDLLSSNWFGTRTTDLINAYQNNNIYPSISSVEFNQYGGFVPDNFSLTLTNQNNSGTIYYTTDNTDPRLPGGAISPNALIYNSSVTLNTGLTTIKSRIFDNGEWSAMCPRKFYIDQNYEDIVINEIHYNPDDSLYFNTYTNSIDTISGRHFEFIELKNKGTDPVFLADLNFTKGVTYKFADQSVILPDSFLVIAENEYWFEQKYGFLPDAVYSGKLSNSGENIWLLDPLDNLIDTLKYDDNLPWDTIPDEGLYSLALIDADLDNAININWSAQSVYTTPGEENLFCPGPITNNYISNDPTCYQYNDGSIVSNVFGGDGGPYNYLWNDGDSIGFKIGLSEGTYILEITDNSRCLISDTITLVSPPDIILNQGHTDQYYYNTADATANILIASGGQSPFSYLWSNGIETSEISNVLPGTYTVEVSDANNCLAYDTIIIQAVDCSNIVLSLSNTDESGYLYNNGTASASVTGSYPPYFYYWNNNENFQEITGLSPGIYQVNVTDSRGCEANDSIEILSYICNLSANILVTDQSYYNTNDGNLEISVNTGVAPYTFQWNTGADSSVINELAPGNYSVSILASDACEITENVTIQQVDCNNLSVYSNINDESCFESNNGTISLTVSGGNFPYEFTWNNGDTIKNIDSLSKGEYIVSIIDSLGCPLTDSIQVSGPDQPLELSANIINESGNETQDGSVDLEVTGGTPPYSYYWINSETTEDIDSLTEGDYWVIVSDFNSCTSSELFTVTNDQATLCEISSNINLINPTANGITVFWTLVNNALNYEVRYRITGETIWNTINSVTNLQIINNLQACTDYELQIITNCSNGSSSDAGPVQYFSTTGCSSICNGVSNMISINETQQSVILQWDLDSGSSYSLFSKALNDSIWNENQLNFPFAVLFGLEPCTTYEWYIIVNCENGSVSNSSAYQQFTTLCTSPKIANIDQSGQPIMYGDELHLYPNPTENLLNIVSDKVSIKSITLFNSYGSTIQNINIDSNRKQIQIQTEPFEPGLYWIDIRLTDGNFHIKQFIKN